MRSSLVLEFVRQGLRALSFWLLAVGMPAQFAPLFDHPQAAELVIAGLSYVIAEVGWVVAKFREWWTRNKK